MTDISLEQWNVAQAEEREFWKSYASTYERYPQILLDHLAQLREVGEFINKELGAKTISKALEIGIGPLGIGVLGIQEPDFRITAIDPLERITLNVQHPALNQYIQALQSAVTYQRSQGETLAFDDESYDLVCCHNVIDHAQHPASILESIFRVLKKGHCLYLTLNTFSALGRFKFELQRRLTPEKMLFVCHPHSFRHADVVFLLSKIGYKVIRQENNRNPIFGSSCLSKFVCLKPD
jgi:2-polyprenyl-3-methyl-5-hydroxy-6-metoxy-1,4-benzoquinol methylase